MSNMTERQTEIVENLFLTKGDAYASAVGLLYSMLLKDAMCLKLAEEMGLDEAAGAVLEAPGSITKVLGDQTMSCAVVLVGMLQPPAVRATDFGADLTGKADSTAALQNAINETSSRQDATFDDLLRDARILVTAARKTHAR